MRTRVCWFCLLAVSVHADPTRFLYICTDQVDSSANPPSVFPCLEVDPCISVGNSVPSDVWLDVGTTMAWTNPAQTVAPYQNRIYTSSIQSVRVPTGVTLRVAQVDFTLYTSNANLYNKLDETTEMKIIGDCTDTTDSNCDDFPEQTGSRIIPGGLQVFSWSLGSGYSCSHATVAPGQRLEPPTPPYTLIDCTKPDVATWNVDKHIAGIPCEYDCPENHIKDLVTGRQSCTFECDYDFYAQSNGNAWVHSNPGCGTRQRSSWTCQTRFTQSPEIYYICQDCTYSPNYASRNSVYDATGDFYGKPAYKCDEIACPDHHTGQDGECLPCPVNTQRPAGDASCSACPSWKHTTTSGEACIDCFTPPNTVAQCPEGMQRVSDVNTIETYFGDQATTYFNKRLFCEQNYACLPCKPGNYLTSQNTCEQCPLGKYQPNHATTECFICGSGKNTHQLGSTDVSSCVCDKGYAEIA